MKLEKSRVSLDTLGIGAIIMTTALAYVPSAQAATANISASANIVPPVGISERNDMRFSGFVAGATPGTITLLVPSSLPDAPPTSATPIMSGGRLRAGGAKLIGGTSCAALSNCGVGAVQIGGPASASFSGVSAQTTTTLTAGDNTIMLNRIELRYGAGGTTGAVTGSGALNPDGKGTIVVGGVLNVAARLAAGNYTGSLGISVDY